MKIMFALTLGLSISMLSCNSNTGNAGKEREQSKDSMQSQLSDSANIKEEAVDYNSNGTALKGYVAYDASKQG